MTLRRNQIETILINRRESLMSLVGMEVTKGGTNVDLNDPIGFAVRKTGGTVANFTSVMDTDIATVDESNYDALLDWAELRLVKNIKGNLDKVDMQSGPFTEKYGQLANSLKDDIATMEQSIADNYGSPITTGVIQADFADHNETYTDGSSVLVNPNDWPF